MRIALIVLGIIALILGVAGIVLPVVPGAPFIALSVYCFSKSSSRLERWVLNLPYVGTVLRRWEKYQNMNPRAKWAALIALTVVIIALVICIPAPRFVRFIWGGAVLVLIAFAVFGLGGGESRRG